MRHGCGFTDVRLKARIEYVAFLVVHPEGRHRYLGVAFAVHAVAEVGAVVLVALSVALHAVRFEDLVLEVVVILGDHVSDRPSPVEKEALGLFRAVKYHSCQRRHPAEKVVAFAGLELCRHIHCPCLRSCLETVREEVFDAALAELAAGRIDVGLEIVAEIFCDRLRVELVHLKTGGFRRCGVVGLAGQAVAEAEYSPVAFRCVPVELTVLYVRQTVETVPGLVAGQLDPGDGREGELGHAKCAVFLASVVL